MRKSLTVILAAFALSSAAQSEIGLWLGAEASYDITDSFGADLELGARLEDGFSTFTRYDAALGFQYKPIKWLKLGAGYDFIRDYSFGETEIVYKTNADGSIRLDSDGNRVVKGVNVDDVFWRTKHRVYFDLTEKWKLGRIGVSLRERYQLTRYVPADVYEFKYREEYDTEDYREAIGKGADVASFYGPVVGDDHEEYYYELDAEKTGWDDKKAKTKHYLRTRLAVDYNIRRCPVTPFASYEPVFDLGDAFSIVRHRVSAGIDWNLTANKQHALSLAYIYQHGAQEEVGNADLHMISVGYKFSFESALAKAQKAAKKKAKKQNKK